MLPNSSFPSSAANLTEQTNSEPQVQTAGFDRDSTITLLEQDMNFFAATVIPQVFRFLFPQIHIEVWELLKKYVNLPGVFFRLALGLPRGHAKTTLIKLFVVYCVLFTKKKFILIVGNTSGLAENILSDIMDMLSSENIISVFGNWKIHADRDTQELKSFTFLGRRIILAAIGAGTGLRGLNLNNERPDVIICDDVQKREDCESKVVSDKLLGWLLGTLFKAKSPSGCLYVYIGNMYPGENCILGKFKKSSEWISFIVGALLADGGSIWPELHSPEDLLAELHHDMDLGKPEIFFAEVQNDPTAGISSHFDVTKVPIYPFVDQDLVTGGFVLIDLSGNKPGSDDTTIGYFCFIEGKIVYRRLVVGKFSPYQTIEAAMKVAFEFNCPHIFIESVAYQASFLYWFTFICEQRGISGFQLYEIYPRGIAKNRRIINFFKQLLGGEIVLHPSIRTQVLYQASLWNPNRGDNEDDIIDLGGYVDFVMSDYAPMLINSVQEILANLQHEAKVTEDCSSF